MEIAMNSEIVSFRVLLLSLCLVMTMTRADLLYAAKPADPQGNQPTSASISTSPAAMDVTGTWSGTFFSKHSNVPPFTMTVVITPNSRGHLVGNSSLNSHCLQGAKLQVTVNGSKLVLAGSDPEGDNFTVQGRLDNTGTLFTGSYILNSSASGRCETDDGTGTLGKR